MENAERVEVAREKAIVNKTDTADKRKQEWDAKAKNREFAVGEEVLVRKPNMNLKLADSWEGPFIVYKKSSPLSYAIDTGDRKIPSVHQLMKQYQHDSDNPRINSVTSVFESDTKQDDILDRYSEVTGVAIRSGQGYTVHSRQVPRCSNERTRLNNTDRVWDRDWGHAAHFSEGLQHPSCL